MEPQVFTSTMDKNTKITTIAAFCVLSGINILFLFSGIWYLPVGMLVFNLIFFVVSRGFMPDRFEVDEKGLRIVRKFGTIEIPFQDMLAVGLWESCNAWSMVRVGAVSGLYGFAGTFYIPSSPRYVKLFGRHNDNWIQITVYPNIRYAVAPDDISLLHYLQKGIETSATGLR